MTDLDFNTSDKMPHDQPASFYPNFITPEEGHPMTDHFEVVNTGDERGRGLKSKVPFHKGERVAQLSGIITSHVTINTIQITPTLHFHDQWFCRFLLHSCDPNLAIDVMTLEARATHAIEPREYATIDYRATEDVIAIQFPCSCGAENCCGWMRGRTEKPNEEGRLFLFRGHNT